MKIIAFLRDEEAIEKILRHLGLWDPPTRAPPLRSPRGPGTPRRPRMPNPGWFPDPAWQDDIPVVAGF